MWAIGVRKLMFLAVVGCLLLVRAVPVSGQAVPRSEVMLSEFVVGFTLGTLINLPALRYYVEQGTGNTSCEQGDRFCRQLAYTLGVGRLLQSEQFLVPLGTAAGIALVGFLQGETGNLALGVFGSYFGAFSGIVLASTLIGIGNSLVRTYDDALLDLISEDVRHQLNDLFAIVSDFTLILVPTVLSAAFGTIGYNTELSLSRSEQPTELQLFEWQF